MRVCVPTQSGVFIEEVVDTLDFSAFIRSEVADAPALDPAFGGFGYTGTRGDEDLGTRVRGTAGYHLLSIAPGPGVGTSVAHFQRYQQSVLNTIAFDSSDLPACERAEAREFPCVLAVESAPEPVTVLLRRPAGQLALALRADGWYPKLEATVRKIKQSNNGAGLLDVRLWWDAYLQRSNTRADPAVLARALLPEASGGLARVPRGVVRLGVAQAVMANAVIARPASTITSSLAAPAAVRAAVAAQAFDPFAPLPELIYVMVRVRAAAGGAGAAAGGGGRHAVAVPGWQAGAGGYPACLAQVVRSVVLRCGQRSVDLRWWKLFVNPEAGVDVAWAAGKWVPWVQGAVQWRGLDRREVVGFAPVALIPSSVASGPLHNQWLRLTADSQRAVHLALGKTVA